MVTIAMIALIVGILLFVISSSADTDKSLRNGAIIMMIGAIIGGCFATPSRDMPSGTPGAAMLSIIIIALGAFMVAKKIISTKKGEKEESDQETIKGKIPLIIVGVIFFILIVFAATSSKNSSHPSEPWKDLGVSKREYMNVYNHYKYGTSIK